MSEYLTPEEVAAELRLSLAATYRGLRRGDIPGVKIGALWRTLPEQLREAVRDSRTPTPRKQDPMPKRRFQDVVVDLDSRRVANG